MVLSFMLGEPEETLCGWICSAFLMTQMTTPGPRGCPSVYNCPTPSPNYPHTTSKHRCLLDILHVVSDPEGFKELVLFS